MLDNVVKNKYFILFTIGIILILLSFSLLFYDRYVFVKNGVFSDVALRKYNESQLNNSDSSIDEEMDNNQNVSVDTDYVVDNNDNGSNENNNPHDNGSNGNNNSNVIPESEYIGFLKIDEINLKVGLVAKESRYNHVDRNVQILDPSDYPNVINGNFILASHSGTSKISYFKHLYKLELGDIATIFYKDYIYNYKIVDIYNVPKTGSLEVKRDSNKTVLTLITCTKDSKTLQTVYILELFSKTRNGEVND